MVAWEWRRLFFCWGPRALGNRNILADPRRAEMKDLVIIPQNAYRIFARSELDLLVSGDCLIAKKE